MTSIHGGLCDCDACWRSHQRRREVILAIFTRLGYFIAGVLFAYALWSAQP